jgi:hypothetical protein
MNLLKTTRGFSRALDLSTILWRSLCGQFIRARKLAAAANAASKTFQASSVDAPMRWTDNLGIVIRERARPQYCAASIERSLGFLPDGSILFQRKRTSRPVKADFLEINKTFWATRKSRSEGPNWPLRTGYVNALLVS